jgi:hypothetical protein
LRVRVREAGRAESLEASKRETDWYPIRGIFPGFQINQIGNGLDASGTAGAGLLGKVGAGGTAD